MGHTVIAPVGDNLKALYVGMKDFPTERVIFITPKKNLKAAEKAAKKLEDFMIKIDIEVIDGNMMEEMFRTFAKIVNIYNHDDILVNVATGDRILSCAALSAAFANGLKAIGVMDDQTMVLPIMKLSYYQELSDNKMKILHQLDGDEYISLKELSEKLKMSISLLSYHINGNQKYKGLKEFRLLDIKEKEKNVYVKLSQMGKLLLRGYIKHGQGDKLCC